MTNMEAKMADAEIAKMMAQTAKLNAETAKIHKESFWYPIVVAGGIMAATATLVKLFF